MVLHEYGGELVELVEMTQDKAPSGLVLESQSRSPRSTSSSSHASFRPLNLVGLRHTPVWAMQSLKRQVLPPAKDLNSTTMWMWESEHTRFFFVHTAMWVEAT